ncbi:MAG: paraquat-inducible protein A [Betaproteobacteria bacterium]|nr:paraquat-inducible protein A [Betaproteobacteria bacterium]
MPEAPLIACPECDLLQAETPLPPRRTACCRRCGVALYRSSSGSLDRALAFALAAVVLLVIANSLPIAGLEVTGQHTETTLWGAVQALYDQDRVAVAGLVFATTLFAPAVELALMLYMLVPLRLGRVPRHLSLAFRLAPLAHEWGLVDVFMLGVVVSLIKLGNLATVVPGIALWSFGVLIVLLTAVGASFDAREFWLRAATNRAALDRAAGGTRERALEPAA